MKTLNYVGADLRWLFETLVEACEITSRESERPAISVNGKRYEGFDLVKVALLLPDEPLQRHHQTAADELFKKRQDGYRHTAVNLAHRANQIFADAQFRRSRGLWR
jgi:hypothetical protein